MELLGFIELIIVFALIYIFANRNKSAKDDIYEKKMYFYDAKDSLMTDREKEFFKILQDSVAERYLVFPQVHLSSLLDHKMPNQDWLYAFRHINGKSVDYVLCDKDNLKPVYAIELDDSTHSHRSRMERDREVERIFVDANIPLVRFNEYRSLTKEKIIKRLSEAYSRES